MKRREAEGNTRNTGLKSLAASLLLPEFTHAEPRERYSRLVHREALQLNRLRQVTTSIKFARTQATIQNVQ